MTTFISNFGKIVNKSKYKEPANEFVVVTKKDNLVHNYFFYCDNFWDSDDCFAQITIGFAKDRHEDVKYWTNYQDELVYIYMGNDVSKKVVENNKYYDIKESQKPFFVGRVAKVTEGDTLMYVKVHNIGERFKMKIPDEFREKYINGQNVRDAFQAICEFLGVYYICPPNVAPKDGSQDPDGDKNNPQKKSQKENANVNQIKQQSQNKQKNDTTSGSSKQIKNVQKASQDYQQAGDRYGKLGKMKVATDILNGKYRK